MTTLTNIRKRWCNTTSSGSQCCWV